MCHPCCRAPLSCWTRCSAPRCRPSRRRVPRWSRRCPAPSRRPHRSGVAVCAWPSGHDHQLRLQRLLLRSPLLHVSTDAPPLHPHVTLSWLRLHCSTRHGRAHRCPALTCERMHAHARASSSARVSTSLPPQPLASRRAQFCLASVERQALRPPAPAAVTAVAPRRLQSRHGCARAHRCWCCSARAVAPARLLPGADEVPPRWSCRPSKLPLPRRSFSSPGVAYPRATPPLPCRYAAPPEPRVASPRSVP